LQMFKQAQKLQSELSKVQDDLAKQIFEAESGGGAVKIIMNGRMEVNKIIINPEFAAGMDYPMIADLITAALNECLRRVQEFTSQEMKKISGGLPLPDML